MCFAMLVSSSRSLPQKAVSLRSIRRAICPKNQTPAMARFKQDKSAQNDFATTLKLKDMRSEDFDAVFYPGGHGPMWDLVDNPDSISLIEILL